MFPNLVEHPFIQTKGIIRMSITTARTLRNLNCQNYPDPYFKHQVTVSTIIKIMLEIIQVKKGHLMDKEIKEQFPMIARTIILLAEQIQ